MGKKPISKNSKGYVQFPQPKMMYFACTDKGVTRRLVNAVTNKGVLPAGGPKVRWNPDTGAYENMPWLPRNAKGRSWFFDEDEANEYVERMRAERKLVNTARYKRDREKAVWFPENACTFWFRYNHATGIATATRVFAYTSTSVLANPVKGLHKRKGKSDGPRWYPRMSERGAWLSDTGKAAQYHHAHLAGTSQPNFNGDDDDEQPALNS